MEQEILQHLEQYIEFRERRKKDKGIALILKEKYKLDVDTSLLTRLIQDANSMDRFWRKSLLENEHLRGNDYGDKRSLEQKKEVELGYEENYRANVKKLRTI